METKDDLEKLTLNLNEIKDYFLQQNDDLKRRMNHIENILVTLDKRIKKLQDIELIKQVDRELA